MVEVDVQDGVVILLVEGVTVATFTDHAAVKNLMLVLEEQAENAFGPDYSDSRYDV